MKPNEILKNSLIALVLMAVAAGCGSGEASQLTKEQEDAIRHPKADPNYKGPNPADLDKMNKAMADYKAKHANDKVEFNSK